MENNFDPNAAGQKPLLCVVCNRVIVDGQWFARFKFGSRRVVACRPNCMEKFLDQQEVYAAKLGVPLAANHALARSFWEQNADVNGSMKSPRRPLPNPNQMDFSIPCYE
jgi:hypothetical protein